MPYTLTLHNNVQEVSLLAPFIETIAMENGLDHSLTMELNLAVEEAVVNVMEYAYPQGETGEVTIEVSVADGLLDINIIDSGAPFDPTKKNDPDTSLPVEERSIGGLGIFLVRQVMDTVSYRRDNGKNILTFTKNIKM
ncbi:MAG: ATP-binding protein [Bacteroidales bacterium]|nr:ATP-binding protein [Bacteroidales bacterium]